MVGYHGYLRRIADLTVGKELLGSGMRQEAARCRAALAAAAGGRAVALVSSGDPGVYGMAGLALELRAAEGLAVPVAIVPGVSAANAAAARLGAPLMLDYAVVSLSDLLVPLDQILKRLEAVVGADLVVALYNPKSRTRTAPWEAALRVLATHRPPETPAAVATALGSVDEALLLTDLGGLPAAAVDMHSVVIVGNRSSRVQDGFFLTPRGYRL